jgi:hypothetical protein
VRTRGKLNAIFYLSILPRKRLFLFSNIVLQEWNLSLQYTVSQPFFGLKFKMFKIIDKHHEHDGMEKIHVTGLSLWL